jgi:hypothetical protein
VATGVRDSDVTSFPAIRAIIEAVHAETDILHALADGAIFFAGALVLRLVALTAKHRADGHRSLLKKTLPELAALRQVADLVQEADESTRSREVFRTLLLL